MIKKSLHLKAQHAKVKAKLQVSKQVDTRISKNNPTFTTEVEELGSREAPWLVLATGQSTYIEPLVTLAGVMPLSFSLHYVSQSHKKGFFGEDRASSYEKHFTHVGKGVYHLDLPCGRTFAFSKQADASFKDEGDLGVEVEAMDANRFVLTYHEGEIEYYSHGYLVGRKDRNGNTLTLEYAQGPQLIRIRNTFGASLDFSYNTKNLLSSMQDQSGRTWRFTYGEDDVLVSIYLDDTMLVSYEYVSSLLEGSRVSLLSHVYTANGQERLSLSYEETLKLHSYTQEGASYTYRYNDARSVVREDAQGKQYRYGLDSRGLIASIGYPDGTQEAQKYHETNHTATIQTRGGNERVEVYDERARLLSVSINGAIVMVYSYEAKNPYPVSLIKDGKTLYYSYDSHYNLIGITYPDRTEQTYSYTKEGQLHTQTDALGHTTTYSYNDKAQLVEIQAPNGAKQHLSYDDLGRVIAQEDALGYVRSYSYTNQDQIAHYRDPQGESIVFGYTPEGRLQTLTDPAQRVTKYHYDTQGRLLHKQYPDGSKESYSYYADANLARIQRVDGSTLAFSYDDNQNITNITAKDPEGKEEVRSYDYDALSNLLRAKSPSHTLRLQYNERASLTAEIQNDLTLRKTYGHNHTQRQSLGILGEWIHYGYDGSENIAHIRYLNQEIKLRYDANHLPTKRVYPNQHKEQMVYDKAHNLTSLKSHTDLAYTYDDTGRLVEKHNKETQAQSSFKYSPGGALIQATSINSADETSTQYYSYNLAGNLTHKEQRYNQLNQLIEDAQTLYAYDKRGNLIEKLQKASRQRSIYRFNLFDQLVKVKTVDKAGTLIEGFSFSYAPQGHFLAYAHGMPSTEEQVKPPTPKRHSQKV